LYGINDNYESGTSHVLPALIQRAHQANHNGDKAISVWGTGTARREFLFAEDLANACVFLMESEYSGPLLNIGSGEDITIRDVAILICGIVGFNGALKFDTFKPNGIQRKLMNIERIRSLGWRPEISLEAGIKLSYADFLHRVSTGNVEDSSGVT
jgi:GDP-L-fucose synthase